MNTNYYRSRLALFRPICVEKPRRSPPAMPTFLALIGQKIAASILCKTGIHNVYYE